MVRKPSGSTERAISRASLLTRSTLAGLTARMRHVGCRMYVCTSDRMRRSMSVGWSPTGFFANPGRSTSVIVLCFEQAVSILGSQHPRGRGGQHRWTLVVNPPVHVAGVEYAVSPPCAAARCTPPQAAFEAVQGVQAHETSLTG